MVTRVYLPSTGTPSISPAFDAGWEVTTNADRRTAVTTRISSAMTNKDGAGDTTTTDQLLRQYILGPVGSQTISGTIKGQMRIVNNTGTAVGMLKVAIAKCASDGSGVTQILAPTSSSTIETAPPGSTTTLTNRRLEEGVDDFALNLTSTGVNDGDFLIIELGYKDQSGNAARFMSINFGDDSGTDLAEDETTTTANNPWVEFSMDITFSGGGPPATPAFRLSLLRAGR